MSLLSMSRRRTIRSEVNPMDKCTIVSMYPKPIREVKHTIQPGVFVIPAGSYESPGLLVVGSSSWWRDIDEDQPLLEIPNSSIQVADSVVKDWANGLLCCNMSDTMPGIGYVMGEFSLAKLIVEKQDFLSDLKAKQINWYRALVKMADINWARSNGSALTISDDMRAAAKQLGLTEKDWMSDHLMMDNVRCTACGSMRNPAYPVCPVCKAVVDTDKAKKLDLKFAQ